MKVEAVHDGIVADKSKSLVSPKIRRSFERSVSSELILQLAMFLYNCGIGLCIAKNLADADSKNYGPFVLGLTIPTVLRQCGNFYSLMNTGEINNVMGYLSQPDLPEDALEIYGSSIKDMTKLLGVEAALINMVLFALWNRGVLATITKVGGLTPVISDVIDTDIVASIVMAVLIGFQGISLRRNSRNLVAEIVRVETNGEGISEESKKRVEQSLLGAD